VWRSSEVVKAEPPHHALSLSGREVLRRFGWCELCMTELNIDSDQDSSIEEIPVDSRLKWLLELSIFPQAQLEYPAAIHNVHPCPWCGEPVARVRLGHELRIVDAIFDRANSEPFNRRWTANVLAEHACAEVEAGKVRAVKVVQEKLP
jgi:hypothetical protein